MDYENPFVASILKVMNMLFLSLLWGVFCLPVVTIIPSCGALYYAVAKSVRHERGRAFPMFWKSFKGNLRAGIPATLILFAVMALTFFNGNIALQMEGSFSILLLVCDVLVFLLAFFVTLWAPCVLARFEVNCGQLLRASFRMETQEIGVTILLCLMAVLTILLTFITYGLALFLLPSLVSWAAVKLTEKKLNACIETDENYDKWYLEE